MHRLQRLTVRRFLRRARAFDRLRHLAIVAVSLVAAFLLRFDFSIPPATVPLLTQVLWIALFTKIVVFHFAGFHHGWRRYAGMADLIQLFTGNVLASGLFGCAAFLRLGRAFPRSIYFLDFILCLFLTALAHFAVRLYGELMLRPRPKRPEKHILIYGAGDAGHTLLREIRANRGLGYEVLGFLDDDPRKWRAAIMGVPILGSGRKAASVVDDLRKRRIEINEIVIAMPSASGRAIQEALANCRGAGVECKTIPGVGELLSGKVLTAQIRRLSVADLLGRQPVRLDEGPIRSSIAGRSILVTGAAGSIGSELCQQLARFGPARVIALDQAESELFRIDSALRSKFPELEVIPRLGDIRDYRAVAELIERYSVDSIFHAAAYKHVPILESHVFEAVQNNVLGTWNLVLATRQHPVSSFLMVSSDKAVNPTSVMGATKRVCERIVSAAPTGRTARATRFVSVRFGNVLGSNGSVVPLFQAQIAAGGPVTITHPEMRRYFMTIPEAVALVLQASTMGKGSEIFVLDMGEPVRIVDLAVNMIQLAGLRPYEDIDIRFVGLRPGEKLFEEIKTEGENILPTYHEKIKIFQDVPMSWNLISEWVRELEALLAERREPAVVEHIKSLIPEYRPDGTRSEGRPQVLVKAAGAGQAAWEPRAGLTGREELRPGFSETGT